MKVFQSKRLNQGDSRAFTLVEILVSLTVLSMLLLITANVINQVQKTWSAAAARVSQFREARVAFEVLTQNLRQATLNAHIDYDFNYLATGANGLGTPPSQYLRKSDLHFVVGSAATLVAGGGGGQTPGHAVFFQAPLGIVHDPLFTGLGDLLCGRGYFVQYSNDDSFRPPFVHRSRSRFRLMDFSPPSKKNLIYEVVPPGTPTDQRLSLLSGWYAAAGAELTQNETADNRGLTRPVADNILTLVLSPRLDPANAQGLDPVSIAPNYSYDSANPGNRPNGTGAQGTLHLLPPQIRVAMVAIDEKTADRLDVDGELEQLAEIVGKGFTDASALGEDLEALSEALIQEKVNFRIFTGTISLLSAKWSQ